MGRRHDNRTRHRTTILRNDLTHPITILRLDLSRWRTEPSVPAPQAAETTSSRFAARRFVPALAATTWSAVRNCPRAVRPHPGAWDAAGSRVLESRWLSRDPDTVVLCARRGGRVNLACAAPSGAQAVLCRQGAVARCLDLHAMVRWLVGIRRPRSTVGPVWVVLTAAVLVGACAVPMGCGVGPVLCVRRGAGGVVPTHAVVACAVSAGRGRRVDLVRVVPTRAVVVCAVSAGRGRRVDLVRVVPTRAVVVCAAPARRG
ncbi:hypothetical protein GCM10010530_78870 [Kribbella aluminosa]